MSRERGTGLPALRMTSQANETNFLSKIIPQETLCSSPRINLRRIAPKKTASRLFFIRKEGRFPGVPNEHG